MPTWMGLVTSNWASLLDRFVILRVIEKKRCNSEGKVALTRLLKKVPGFHEKPVKKPVNNRDIGKWQSLGYPGSTGADGSTPRPEHYVEVQLIIWIPWLFK